MKRLSVGIGVVMLLFLSLSVGVRGDQPVKKGVGATYVQSPEDCTGLQEVGASWFYNWGPTPPICSGVESVPMIWSFSSVGREIGGDSPYLAGPNEPDCIFQAWMLPKDAALAWRALEEAYPNQLLISPAVMDLGWLEDFYAYYLELWGEPPRLQGLAVHCYLWTDNAESQASYCRQQVSETIQMAEDWGVPEVWLTEFAYLCGQDEGLNYMRQMMLWLEAQKRVTRYAWFQLSYAGTEPWAFGPWCNTSILDYEDFEKEEKEITFTSYGELYRREMRIFRLYLPILTKPGQSRESLTPASWDVELYLYRRGRCVARPCQ